MNGIVGAARRVVTMDDEGCIGIARLNHPPVNTLNADVRRCLSEILARVAADPGIEALLLLGDGRHFCAGSDVREFGSPRGGPPLREICDTIAHLGKPVVVSMHGAALGGGLELALAAHFHVAALETQLAAPEVLLGLLPGAGGTQRPSEVDTAARAAIGVSRSSLGARYQGLCTLQMIIDAMEASLELPFADGVEYERRLFDECLNTPQHRVLRQIFLARKGSSPKRRR